MTHADPFSDHAAVEGPDHATVRVTGYFDTRLAEIERLSSDADFERLIEDIAQEVIPLLERTPSVGRRILELHPDGDEAPPMMSELLQRAAAAGGDLLVYAFGAYRLLYLHADAAVYLLSIRRNAG
jgi:hypothetical protein